MNHKQQILLYMLLLIIGLSGFILQLFVWEGPDGTVGLMICLTNVICIIGSTIRLCQVSQSFKRALFDLLDILFCIR